MPIMKERVMQLWWLELRTQVILGLPCMAKRMVLEPPYMVLLLVAVVQYLLQSGTGRAGQFQIGNPSNTDAALRGFTNGLGRAGFFTVNNPASTASGVYAESNASGPVIEARSTAGNNGVAFKLTEGGFQVSVETVATAGNIAKKAVAYHLQAAGAYTTTFTLNDGDVFFFFNSNAAPATINGLPVAAGAGINCIVIAGTLRQI